MSNGNGTPIPVEIPVGAIESINEPPGSQVLPPKPRKKAPKRPKKAKKIKAKGKTKAKPRKSKKARRRR